MAIPQLSWDPPTIWIDRTIQQILTSQASVLGHFPATLLLGPRQVGKSSVLRHLSDGTLGTARRIVNLDDLATRAQVNADPALFAAGLTLPIIVDEIQYAPMLLSALKRLVDEGAPPQSIWVTGSQSFEVMKGVNETMAGRVALLNLFGLSDEEKFGSSSPNSEQDSLKQKSPEHYFERIYETSFPKLYNNRSEEYRELYLSSYVQTYIERDVRELLGVQKRCEFELFVKACALRTGQLLNFEELGRSVGISATTAKEWVSILEDSFLLKVVQPWHQNHNKRLVKTPKLYFLDMGLAAYLAGWKSAEMLFLGPMRGPAFETHVFGSIYRFLRHRGLDANIHFLRTREGLEVDFIVETFRGIFPVEVKSGSPDARALPDLSSFQDERWKPASVISLAMIGRDAAPIAKHWIARSPLGLSFLIE